MIYCAGLELHALSSLRGLNMSLLVFWLSIVATETSGTGENVNERALTHTIKTNGSGTTNLTFNINTTTNITSTAAHRPSRYVYMLINTCLYMFCLLHP